jgi:hypothetical protein
MTISERNCFRSQYGSIIELTSPVSESDTQLMLGNLADTPGTKPERANPTVNNPVARAIRQYYFYD